MWSGIGWDRLQPLIDHGLLPTVSLLLTNGVRGQLTGLQPQLPIQLSQSLCSGQFAWRHGLLHPLRVESDGSIGATTLADAAEPGLPAWLEQNDLPAIWVGWPQMTPGTYQSQHMVNRAFIHADAGGGPDLPLQDCRVPPSAIGIAHLKPFFTEWPDEEILADPLVPGLQALLAAAGSLQAACTRLMQRKQWRLASIRFELSDQVSQLCGDCHPPLQGDADPQRVIRYQYVVTGALRLLDMMLARLVQLAGPEALVLVHSDKGTAKPAPATDSSAPVHRRFRAGHSDRGFLLMAGPGVRSGEPLYAASILDIAPTVMAALGLDAPPLPGRVLREGLEDTLAPAPKRDATEPAERSTASLPETETRHLVRDDAIRHGESPPADELTAALIDEQTRLYQALSMMQYGAAEPALALFEELTRDHPESRRYMLHRARCHLLLGQLDRARDWAERFAIPGEPDLQSHLLLGRIALLQDRTDHALVHFFQAEQLSPDDPYSHCEIGDAYRRGEKLEQARDAFQRALLLDPLHVGANLGLARIELLKGNNESASEACLLALESDYRNADAHFHLGVALARLERIKEAIQAFEAALSLAPDRAPAHEWLARLYKLTEGGIEKAAMHQALAACRT